MSLDWKSHPLLPDERSQLGSDTSFADRREAARIREFQGPRINPKLNRSQSVFVRSVASTCASERNRVGAHFSKSRTRLRGTCAEPVQLLEVFGPMRRSGFASRVRMVQNSADSERSQPVALWGIRVCRTHLPAPASRLRRTERHRINGATPGFEATFCGCIKRPDCFRFHWFARTGVSIPSSRGIRKPIAELLRSPIAIAVNMWETTWLISARELSSKTPCCLRHHAKHQGLTTKD
jgi:hypothetical protein